MFQSGDIAKWVWLKIKQEGLRRFWSIFHLQGSILVPGFLSHSQMGRSTLGSWYPAFLAGARERIVISPAVVGGHQVEGPQIEIHTLKVDPRGHSAQNVMFC